MTDRLITHLRHVDLAVPDFDKQLDFYTGTWGLTAEHSDTGLAFLAAEGSPGAVRRPAAQAADKRIDLISFGAASAGRRRHPGRPARPPTGCGWSASPATLQTPGGGYGFRFFDNEGRTVEISSDVAVRAAPQDRGGRVDPGPAVARRDQLAPTPEATRRVLRAAPGLRAVRHPDAPAHGRDDVVHADQRLAPQPGHRPRPAPVAAPRLVRDARHRRVHARHRPAAARRRGEDLGPGPAPGRQQHLQLLPRPARQHRRVHHRARADRRGHLAPAPVRLHPARGQPTSGAPRTDERVRRAASRSTTPTRACSSPRRSDGRRCDSPPGSTGGAVRAGRRRSATPGCTRCRPGRRCSTWSAPGCRPRSTAGAAALDGPAVPLDAVRLLPPLAAADRAGLRRVRGARRGRGRQRRRRRRRGAGVVPGADVLLHQPVRADRRARRRAGPARARSCSTSSSRSPWSSAGTARR